MSWVPRDAKRKSIPSIRYKDGIAENELAALDPGINSLVDRAERLDKDDFDWVASVPGRPSPYPTTWNLVYSIRKPNNTGGFDVDCQERNDGVISLNGQFQEIGASATPHGMLRKPPVCHVIPWVLLSLELDEFARHINKTLKEDFCRFVCWGDVGNLRTGHNGCNAGGSKVTALSATSSDRQGAAKFIQKCATEYSSNCGPIFKL